MSEPSEDQEPMDAEQTGAAALQSRQMLPEEKFSVDLEAELLAVTAEQQQTLLQRRLTIDKKLSDQALYETRCLRMREWMETQLGPVFDPDPSVDFMGQLKVCSSLWFALLLPSSVPHRFVFMSWSARRRETSCATF